MSSKILLLALAAGCGDNNGVSADAFQCWPLRSSPGGAVELGTGELTFQPMPDTVALIANQSQSDPYIDINARIRGLPPGSTDDFFDPTNPRTKVSAHLEELAIDLSIDCPATIGYKAAPDAADAYDLLHSLRIGIGTLSPAEVANTHATVTVEVVGSNGLYAKDTKLILLTN